MLRETAGRGQHFSITRKESCYLSLHIARNINCQKPRQITRHIARHITLYITLQVTLHVTRQIIIVINSHGS